MKQFLAVAALNEAVEKHCDTRRDVKIYTEGFKAVQHEAMEFSVMCDGELYQLENYTRNCDRLVFLIPPVWRKPSCMPICSGAKKRWSIWRVLTPLLYGKVIPSSVPRIRSASPNLLSDQGQLHLDQLPDSASAGCFGYTGRSESRGTFGAVCLWPQHQ